MVLSRAQELAVEGGFVDEDFHEKWLEVQKRIFAEYTGRIDKILGARGFAENDFKAGGPVHEAFHKKPIWGPADTGHGLA
jgi:hypothetical protein